MEDLHQPILQKFYLTGNQYGHVCEITFGVRAGTNTGKNLLKTDYFLIEYRIFPDLLSKQHPVLPQ